MSFPKFLRIASLPYTLSIKINETTSVEKKVTGIYDDILAKIIAGKLGFSFKTVTPSDRQFGSISPNGNWTGMVGMLLNDEADIIIRTLSITEERREAIEFSYPYYIDRLVFVTRKLERSIDIQSFLKPFSLDVWLCLTACIFIIVAAFSALLKVKGGLSDSHKNDCSYFLFNSVAPKGTPEYFLRMSWIMFQTLLRWSYTAVLLAFVTFPTLYGVRNIPELANAVLEGKYLCFAYPGGFVADCLLGSLDTNLKVIGQNVKANEGYFNFDAALSNPELSAKPAYIGEESQFIGVNTKYFVSEEGLFSDYRAIGTKKDFCCRSELDSAIHDIWTSGLYVKLTEDFTRRKTHSILWEKSPDIHSDYLSRKLSLEDFEGVFILLAIGYLCATAVLFIELLLGKFWKRRFEV